MSATDPFPRERDHGNSNNSNKNIWTSLWNYFTTPQKLAQNPPKRNLFAKTIVQRPAVQLNETNHISNVVLALWDNISGPRLEQVWGNKDQQQKLQEEDLLYAARYTLGGDLVSDASSMETKFQVVPERGYFSHSRLFHATYNEQPTLLALSLIFPINSLPHYLRLHHIVNDRVLHLVNMYIYLLKKRRDKALDSFSTKVPEFIKNLDAIFSSKLYPVRFEETLLSGAMAPEDNIDFLSRAITSHLQTHGSTVVIHATDELKINSFVQTLSLFLSCDEKKRACTRVASDRGYVPDLLLQGVLTTKLDDEHVIQSMLPSTLIDLNTQNVRQTYPYQEYKLYRNDYMKLMNTRIIATTTKTTLWSSHEKFWGTPKNPAVIITKIVQEVSRLQEHLREAYITQSMRLLYRRAVVLVKYAEALLANKDGTKPETFLDASKLKKIKQDLELTEPCFFVLLGIAEKLMPGIYIHLVGDPSKLEQQFLELFESF